MNPCITHHPIKCSTRTHIHPFSPTAIHLKPTILDFYEKRAEAFIQICDFRSAILNYRKILEWGNNYKIESKLAFLYYFYGQGK